MKRKLVQWMVCPVTKKRLTLRVIKESRGEIIQGELISNSGVKYKISSGVPRMIPGKIVNPSQMRTKNAFSNKWNRSGNFGHEEKSRMFYLKWYLQRYNFKTVKALRLFLRNKKTILDAGTGTGRDSRLYAELCPGDVFGVDISEGINLAYQHLKSFPNLHLIQADLTKLPFPRQFFDFIACDQVLHHTPDTRKSFCKLVDWLAPKGEIAIYVYKRKAPLRELADDYLRNRAIKMSDADAWDLALRLTELGRALTELNKVVVVPDIPALGIKAGKYDLQRFIYWHFLKCYWNSTLDYSSSVITNFDWYRPFYAYRHTPEEVKNWFRENRLKIITFDEGDSGISVRGRKI
jgi:SAM-dependent methyltransferase